MEPDEEIDKLAHRVIGAAIEVHRYLGPGFTESVYEAALVHELDLQGLACQRQVPVAVGYKDATIGAGRIDLLAANRLIIELKLVESLLPVHHAQLLSYLKATGIQLGLLINFNVHVLRNGIKRIVFTQ
jgi:GxxExxY protein